MTLQKSWVTGANDEACPFPLNNLPYGVFTPSGGGVARCGVAIGDMILDAAGAEAAGLIAIDGGAICGNACWTPLMERGTDAWSAFRARLQDLLAEGSTDREAVQKYLHPREGATLRMPFRVAEFTDFYASRNHATNVGTIFRGAENALPPNWLHIPIGYNGRASSVVVSGTDVRRPWGQLKGPKDDAPRFVPCKRFDLELEMGAIVGTASDGPISVQQADENIFGYVLLNDWSARDIQAWEYQPLGPFQAKATATTISPWIVTSAALEPFRCDTPERVKPLLDYLTEPGPMLFDIDLTVTLAPEGKDATVITRTNYSTMYYSAAQQLTHHTTAGSPMRTGDLLGSGTISGPEKHQRGALLELTWGGDEPLTLDTGETRTFLEDGDTLTLHGQANGDGFTIGFGDCAGTLLPALDDPFKR